MPEAEDHDDDLVAVVAHSLLAPVMSCATAAETLIAHHERLPPEARGELLDLIQSRADLTSGLLIDMIRGGSLGVIEALEGLSAGRSGP